VKVKKKIPMETEEKKVPVYQDLIDEITNELDNRKSSYGQFHPSVAESLNSIALVHLHMLQNPHEALKYHIEACGILLVVFQNEYENMGKKAKEELSIALAVTYSDIGNAKWALEDLDGADAFYRKALETLHLEKLPESHPRAYSIRNRMHALHRY
jgi:hypothetical protein